MYVDDLITSCSSVEEAKNIQWQLSSLLKLGGFHMRKWASSDERVLQDVPQEDREELACIEFGGSNQSIKTLGIQWNPIQDSFQFSFKLGNQQSTVTKRFILSEISRIFDPLGLISPVLIKAKIFIQHLWLSRLGWDDSLTSNLKEEWMQIHTSLLNANGITISRCISNLENIQRWEIHGFCDASINAYAACIYVRAISSEGIMANLLCSKSRVAPLKQVSIPRLELCGAVLLARLVNAVRPSIASANQYYLWTDSKIVLAWLQGEPRRWKSFVANRVSEIQELTEVSCWNHVSTKMNPADIGSRGQSANELLNNDLWWKGPEWLLDTMDDIISRHIELNEEDLPEMEGSLNVTLLTIEDQLDPFSRTSSYTKLVRMFAFVLRFVNNIKLGLEHRVFGALSASELSQSVTHLVKLIQRHHFEEDYQLLQNKSNLRKGSQLKQLRPIMDQDGVIRVGGRLQHSMLPYESKHPAILPKKHHFTVLLIRYEHERLMHAGAQTVLNHIRQRFWIINGKTLIKGISRKCVRCARAYANPKPQVMGQLPSSHTVMSSPFCHTGVDCAGPFNLKMCNKRTKTTYKAYIALFICLTVKAIHIEVISDLTSNAFIAALSRFAARRGKPSILYSDNGTNFVGSYRELLRVYTSSEVQTHSANEGISWKFNPPSAPHFGGLWEAAIKQAKGHLHRTIGDTILTYEELTTVITKIEAVLNSRPLYALSTDPSDYEALTPSHFLIGKSASHFPESDSSLVQFNLLSRWKMVQSITQRFWKRWQSDYLHTLRECTKWRSQRPNLQVGDIVVVKNEDSPPYQWPLGRIVRIYPGEDSIVRVVDVKTKTGTYKRPITKLSLIPLDGSE